MGNIPADIGIGGTTGSGQEAALSADVIPGAKVGAAGDERPRVGAISPTAVRLADLYATEPKAAGGTTVA